MSKAKFRVGDYVVKKTLLYQDENESISNPEKRYKSEMRYYLIFKVFEDNYGLQYRCQRFIDGVAENYTTTINAKLLEDGGEVIGYIDFSLIEKQAGDQSVESITASDARYAPIVDPEVS